MANRVTIIPTVIQWDERFLATLHNKKRRSDIDFTAPSISFDRRYFFFFSFIDMLRDSYLWSATRFSIKRHTETGPATGPCESALRANLRKVSSNLFPVERTSQEEIMARSRGVESLSTIKLYLRRGVSDRRTVP